MSVSYAKKIEVTAAGGSVIYYIFLNNYGPSGTFSADLADSADVHPDAPNEVTATVGSSGFCYFMKSYLTGNSIPISPYADKYPLSLGDGEPTEGQGASELQ